MLSCVFVRFLEDSRLIDPPKIAGPGERLRRARDEHELYFRAHPIETDWEYLLQVFDAWAKWSGTADLFGEHNPIHELPNWLSGDAAGDLGNTADTELFRWIPNSHIRGMRKSTGRRRLASRW